VVQAVREMLAEVGIRVRMEAPPWPEVVAAWTSARLPFFYAGWRFESGDAHSFFVDCLKTRDAGRHDGASNPGFSDPELDRLIDQHAEIFGETNRLRHYEQITRKALEEMPLVPIYTRDNMYAVSRDLSWKPRLDGRMLAAEMSFREAPAP
jgi:peptide/nickel transport system substrate-binding protein